jgi:hypothetical protein
MSSTLKMEAADFSEMLVRFYKSYGSKTQGRIHCIHRSETSKSYV